MGVNGLTCKHVQYGMTISGGGGGRLGVKGIISETTQYNNNSNNIIHFYRAINTNYS